MAICNFIRSKHNVTVGNDVYFSLKDVELFKNYDLVKDVHYVIHNSNPASYIIKGTGHDLFWSGTPINHFQKQGNTYKSKETAKSHEIAEIMKKTGFLANFILGGAQTLVVCEGCLKEKKYDFLMSKNIIWIWYCLYCCTSVKFKNPDLHDLVIETLSWIT